MEFVPSKEALFYDMLERFIAMKEDMPDTNLVGYIYGIPKLQFGNIVTDNIPESTDKHFIHTPKDGITIIGYKE